MVRFALAAVMLYGPFVWCAVRRESPDRYGLFWHLDRTIGRSVAWWCALTLLPLTVMAVFWPTGGIPRSLGWAEIGQFFLAGTTAAAVEEIFFRGWLQSSLCPWVPSVLRIIGVAAFFAAAHMIFQSRLLFLATFFPGLVMGFLRERHGSVTAPFLYHALCNVWAIWFFPNP